MESSPFLSNEVKRHRTRRIVVRAMLMPVVIAVLLGLSQKMPSEQIARFAVTLMPLGVAMLAVKWVVQNVRYPSFGISLLANSIVYLLFFSVYIFLLALGLPQWNDLYNLLVFRHIWSLVAILALFYGMILLTVSIRGISRKLGRGVLLNLISGYYYTPQQEERIFMFLDMRNSTMLAEKLGDLKFSALVRDFFEDLTDPILETRGEVSHYIGDEAVLTWQTNKGLSNANCIQCFYRMRLALQKRADYYQRTYGLIPEFKAGAHIGKVVATEVGKVKSEVVFHGDVLNTAARVQALCNEQNSDLLITSTLAARLPNEPWMHLDSLGDVLLKGKEESVGIVRVTCPQLDQLKSSTLKEISDAKSRETAYTD